MPFFLSSLHRHSHCWSYCGFNLHFESCASSILANNHCSCPKKSAPQFSLCTSFGVKQSWKERELPYFFPQQPFTNLSSQSYSVFLSCPPFLPPMLREPWLQQGALFLHNLPDFLFYLLAKNKTERWQGKPVLFQIPALLHFPCLQLCSILSAQF